MDPEKAALLFGQFPVGLDPDDPEDRAVAIAERPGTPDDAVGGGTLQQVLYETVATQIADEEPPEVWATARRLLGRGLPRDQVLMNLVMAAASSLRATVVDGLPFDHVAYAATLDRLPVPTLDEIEDTMVHLTREHQPIPIDDLERRTGEVLGSPYDEEPFRTVLDRVSDLVMDPDGPLALLAGDVVVEPESLYEGIVLTHRLTEGERELGILTVSVDLVGFAMAEEPTVGPEAIGLEPFSVDEGHLAWHGPKGWLDHVDPGDCLAVRLSEGSVSLQVIAPPLLDEALVADLRRIYDGAVAEPGLPVATEELLLGLLSEDRARFRSPQAAFTDLIDAAGLERRGSQVAHDAEVWENEARHGRVVRLATVLDRRDDVFTALDILHACEDTELGPAALRAAAEAMRDHDILDAVTDEMLGSDEDPELAEWTLAFGQRLIAAARRPGEVAPAHWLTAVASERLGDVLAAEGHLRLAVEADPGWGQATDRLAWYLSDRGRAADAVRLWHNLGIGPEHNVDLRLVEPMARSASAPPGRNDPCWCGSGRKFKQCHRDQPAAAPLPERVGWLWRKAVAYLERRGGAGGELVFDLAQIRAEAQGSRGAFERALADPLTTDLVLTEGGWLRRFLSDRGPLLPDDEVGLAESWLQVDRSVFEILSVQPGQGMTLVDLRTAHEFNVRERTFSRQATSGTVVCARAVPDGASHQFVGGFFPVRAGREAELLDLLDGGDAATLAEYVGLLERPPHLVTREGEPLVICKAVLGIDDPGAARALLDTDYEAREDDTWVEMHELSVGDAILRSTLTLEGERMTVETMSEARLDRTLGRLSTGLGGPELLSEERRPLRPGEMPPVPDHLAAAPFDSADLAEVAEQNRDRFETQWCNEPVPALGGLTPRQAAADPTRRETLERLLLEFEAMNRLVPADGIAMRPERLRQLLGLYR